MVGAFKARHVRLCPMWRRGSRTRSLRVDRPLARSECVKSRAARLAR
jgi:hypothetical protein